MGPRNAYKDVLDNVVSPIACVSMNHQNQLEQMANGSCSLHTFSWQQRYRIIKGVAASLLYPHEDWEQLLSTEM
jgi:hypothetical protein